MEHLIAAGKMILEHGPEMLISVLSLAGAALTVSLIIPGEHPDKELQFLVDKLQGLVNLIKGVSVKAIVLGNKLEEAEKKKK